MRPRFHIPHLRFRTSTLLWLTVVVAAFFVGRQSDEIAARLSQLWPSNLPYRLIPQSDGSLLIVSRPQITGWTAGDLQLFRVTILTPNQTQFTAVADGNTNLTLWLHDKSTGKHSLVDLNFVIKNGRVSATKRNNE
jgi:hypothetical protein